MSKIEQVRNFTAQKISYIQSVSDTGVGRGILAELRRGVGKEIGELPTLWGIVFDGLPEELTGTNKASYAEWAIYTALTLYALHRQGNSEDVNEAGMSVGKAAYKISNGGDDEERIVNRLNLVVTAVSPTDVAYHLKSLIQLMKNANVKLDYVQLAADLYSFNYPEAAKNVKLSWGRDFYSEKYHNTKKENEKNEQ